MKACWIWLFCLLCTGMALAQPGLDGQEPQRSELDKAINALKNGKEPSDRSNAAYRLGQMRDVEAVSALIDALANEKETFVAGTCAQALGGKLFDKRVVPALLNAIQQRKKDSYFMICNLDALLTFADPATREPMLALALDPQNTPPVRVRALDILESLHDPTIGKELLPVIAGGDQFTAPRAALLAGRSGTQEAVPAMITLLQGRTPTMRLVAARTLTLLKNAAAIVPLDEAVHDAEPLVRVAALDALAALQRPDLCPIFQDILQDKDPVMRAHAAAGISGCGNKLAAGSLVSALADTDPAVRAIAAEGLGKYPAAYDQLLPLLADANPATRAAATLALGAIGRADAAPAMVKLLIDPDVTVQTAAVTALGRLEKNAADALLPLLKDKQPLVRARSAEALGRAGTVKAIPALAKLQADPDAFVRLWALTALTAMPEVAPAVFTTALADPDPTVRYAAARQAATRKAQSAAIPLIVMLRDGPPRERIAAYHALCAIAGEDLGLTTDAWDAWAKRHGM